MGKSSLVKAVHAEINSGLAAEGGVPLKLVEIHREDIETLPDLMALLRADPHRFIVFCDDLSFDADDTSYKSLKAVLEGGIEGRPDNVIFYATSNRRHLLPRDMMENERSTAINPGEAVEEKVSLSDRFGLWLGFHNCSQDEYLDDGLRLRRPLRPRRRPRRAFGAEALEWATTRGSRSGRTAWQFIQDLAGRLGTVSGVTIAAPLRAGGEQARDRLFALRLLRDTAPDRPGSTPLRISKCSCGEVTLPVWPDFAITGRASPCSPRFTFDSPLWA